MKTDPMPDLTILYEHPAWFAPLFAVLERRGVDHVAVRPDGAWDPGDPVPPSPLVFNRIAMSSFLRSHEHPIFHSIALLDHWRRGGAAIVNGPDVLAIDASKARQLSLIAGLGLAIPRTRVIHRAEDAPAAAQQVGFPLVIKANIGGSGAGIVRFDDLEALRAAVADGALPRSIDGVLLVQDFVPARGGIVTRVETLDRRFLYALEVSGNGAFDLCPADACAAPGAPPIAMNAVEPGMGLRDAAERIARAVDLDVGGIEMMIDDRDGTPRFYDINALSNFVARPLDVLGWDPHERLVDYLVARIEGLR